MLADVRALTPMLLLSLSCLLRPKSRHTPASPRLPGLTHPLLTLGRLHTTPSSPYWLTHPHQNHETLDRAVVNGTTQGFAVLDAVLRVGNPVLGVVRTEPGKRLAVNKLVLCTGLGLAAKQVLHYPPANALRRSPAALPHSLCTAGGPRWFTGGFSVPYGGSM
ncbi:hypothetical protein B0H13DRAFT_1850095 [Mycena leptocephala]|nr:hypothetical protein B0H13DRAFT_1850095 [Mycena leptocephala]